MSVTAVTVNFRTASLLPALVEGLRSSPLVSEIIVVDNSGELSGSPLLVPGPDLRVVVNSQNIGFGAAVNQSLKSASGDWLLVINPDVRIANICLENLIKAARGRTSLAGPRFYWDDERIFRLPPATGCCLWFDFATNCAQKFELDAELLSFYWILRHEHFWSAEEPFFEPFLSGACLLVERAWVLSRGGRLFDERFFLYYEDTDLCVCAAREGVRPLCVPNAHAVHYYDQSPSPHRLKLFIMARSHAAFLQKHYGLTSPPLPGGLLRDGAVVDLGELSAPPVFHLRRGGTYFELGVNPYFVPFAQAAATGEAFAFPARVWAQLAPGRYYGRERSRAEVTTAVWTWTKR